MTISLSELREVLEEALCDLNVAITDDSIMERPEDKSLIKQKDRLYALLNALPERGTVIIDSKGMTVRNFECGDHVFAIVTDWDKCEEIVVPKTIKQTRDEDIFATREEAEQECRRRNGA